MGKIPATIIAVVAVTLCDLAHAQSPVTAGEPIPTVISCTAHRDSPKQDPAFVVSFLLQGSGDKLSGYRDLNKRPGREDFEGTFDASSGEISVQGQGRYFGRSSWRYAFKGKIAKSSDTQINGNLIQATKNKPEHIARNCLMTFQLSPADFHAAMASAPRSNTLSNETLADQMKALGLRTSATETNRQIDKEQLGRIESGQKYLKNDLAATKDRVTAAKEQIAVVQSITEGLVLPPTERPADWAPRIAAIPVQQQQFCQIVDRYRQQLLDAIEGRNELARTSIKRERTRDLAALLPEGKFENWVLRIVQVDEVQGGSAAVVVIPPCRAKLGNALCGASEKDGMIGKGTAPFRELEKVVAGDFVVMSGAINKLDEKADAKTTAMTPDPSCGEQDDNFALAIRYLARMN
jgi:hypothetical protein